MKIEVPAQYVVQLRALAVDGMSLEDVIARACYEYVHRRSIAGAVERLAIGDEPTCPASCDPSPVWPARTA